MIYYCWTISENWVRSTILKAFRLLWLSRMMTLARLLHWMVGVSLNLKDLVLLTFGINNLCNARWNLKLGHKHIIPVPKFCLSLTFVIYFGVNYMLWQHDKDIVFLHCLWGPFQPMRITLYVSFQIIMTILTIWKWSCTGIWNWSVSIRNNIHSLTNKLISMLLELLPTMTYAGIKLSSYII